MGEGVNTNSVSVAKEVEGMIPTWLRSLDERISTLHQFIGELEIKLTPVLEPPHEDSKSPTEPPSGNSVVDQLQMCTARIEAAQRRIIDLRNRCQL